MSKQLIRKSTIAASVALAFAVPTGAHAIQGVHFDADGTGGAAGVAIVSDFDWGAGHVLYEGCMGLGTAAVGGLCTIYAQGSISAVVKAGGGNISIPAGVGYTFTLQKLSKANSDVGYDGFTPKTESITFSDAGLAVTDLFTIYRNGTGSVGGLGTTPDPLNGTGYVGAAGDIILQGSVTVSPFTVTNTGTVNQNLDRRGSNDFPGVGTLATSGTPTFTIEVLSKNDDYFTDPLTMFTVSFSPDANQTDNSASPFTNTDPAKLVDNVAFTGSATNGAGVGTDGRSDIYCGTTKGTAAGASCSAEFQGDALTSFQTEVVPEPGMLALLGIGLGGLGVSLRRRKSAKAA